MRVTRKNLEGKLEALVELQDRHVMLEMWQEQFDKAPPKNISLDLMRRAIAYRMQEHTLGGIKPATRRYLQEALKLDSKEASAVKLKPLEHTVKPGMRLVREWHGRIYEALVEVDGVLMNGQLYKSLSEAAKAITGVHWSGPRFFGITKVKSK